jgi:hypothetical protein
MTGYITMKMMVPYRFKADCEKWHGKEIELTYIG